MGGGTGGGLAAPGVGAGDGERAPGGVAVTHNNPQPMGVGGMGGRSQ